MWNWLLPSVFFYFSAPSKFSTAELPSPLGGDFPSGQFAVSNPFSTYCLTTLLPITFRFFFLFPLRPSSPPPTPTWHFSSSAGPGNKAVLASPSLSQVVGRVPARNRQEKIERATLVQQFSLLSVIIFDYSKLEMMKL